MPPIQLSDKKNLEHDRLLTAGLAGFCAVAVIELLAIEVLDNTLTISMYCFCIALPVLIMHLANISMEFQIEYKAVVSFESTIVKIASFIAFGGIITLFWHFSWIIGFLFLVCSISAFFIHIHFYNKLIESIKEDSQKGISNTN